MHPYAIDSTEHRSILLTLMVPGIILAVTLLWLLGIVLEETNTELPLWLQALISGPSAAGVTSFFMTKMESGWWRNSLLRKLGIHTPDLNGTYDLVGKTSYQDRKSPEWRATVEIIQTWSSISICLETKTSLSESTSASIHVAGNPTRARLIFEYVNRPKVHAPDTMKPHRGFTELRLVSPGQLSGHYYTHPQHRANYGDMELTKRLEFS